MNPTRVIRHLACILSGLAGPLLAASAAAPAAFARPLPPADAPARPAPAAPQVHTIVVGGCPAGRSR
jgi:hypothetical protein